MQSVILSIAALSGLSCIVLGALGAHYLKPRLSEALMHSFDTAVLYQMVHTLVLLVLSLLITRFPENDLFRWSAVCMIFGIIFFSGSIYVLSIWGYKIPGPVTPMGGFILMGAWGLLFLAGIKNL